ncbi:hypothetical protein DAEQUDRAFT_84378 [Daedalea quercina L-15889]|uniref:Uncharacterized protein n=1 Tax=Daedalea quercina L-15889 TaxID=1314783 RepID=A0A165L3E3_9APHY|nr:hypothetical protein DAEQUDRAFT_84378 [Daedalea quercina L-15889]
MRRHQCQYQFIRVVSVRASLFSDGSSHHGRNRGQARWPVFPHRTLTSARVREGARGGASAGVTHGAERARGAEAIDEIPRARALLAGVRLAGAAGDRLQATQQLPPTAHRARGSVARTHPLALGRQPTAHRITAFALGPAPSRRVQRAPGRRFGGALRGQNGEAAPAGQSIDYATLLRPRSACPWPGGEGPPVPLRRQRRRLGASACVRAGGRAGGRPHARALTAARGTVAGRLPFASVGVSNLRAARRRRQRRLPRVRAPAAVARPPPRPGMTHCAGSAAIPVRPRLRCQPRSPARPAVHSPAGALPPSLPCARSRHDARRYARVMSYVLRPPCATYGAVCPDPTSPFPRPGTRSGLSGYIAGLENGPAAQPQPALKTDRAITRISCAPPLLLSVPGLPLLRRGRGTAVAHRTGTASCCCCSRSRSCPARGERGTNETTASTTNKKARPSPGNCSCQIP